MTTLSKIKKAQHSHNFGQNYNPRDLHIGNRKKNIRSLLVPINKKRLDTLYKPGANEPYMSKEQKEYFKNILLKWQDQLFIQADSTVNNIQSSDEHYPDITDRATYEENIKLELRTRSRELQLIKKIQATIQKIGANQYGLCKKCKQEIGIARLEVRPTADLCINCKTLAEQNERL